MTDRLIVLGSGSSGNATLVQTEGFGVLLDCGFGPQELSSRLQAVGASWQSVNAVVLTHTHTDHWNKYTFDHLRRLNIPLFAHAGHHDALAANASYSTLARAGLTREYVADTPLSLGGNLTLRTVQVPHDSEPTFALRVDAGDLAAPNWSVGLASDLGCVREELLALLHGVDVLAVEFNHDEQMERASRRPRHLVERVLGDFGHLSNRQAAEAVRALAAADEPGGLTAVVQLHLSRDCNKPELAAEAGRAAVKAANSTAAVITASQYQPTVAIPLAARPTRNRGGKALPRVRRSVQPRLPGMEPDAA